MNSQTTEAIQKVITTGAKNFRGLKLPDADFTGMDLKNADFRGCSLKLAKFNNANLTYANFESANCYGADFTDAILHRTNFKDANLSSVIFKPKDAFGITVTLECKSFQDMKITRNWWAGWLFYGLIMEVPDKDARDRLIQAMGVDYWEVLRTQYATRQF